MKPLSPMNHSGITRRSLALLVAAASLVGCATTPRCPNGVNDIYCSSMKDTYAAARAGEGNVDNVLGNHQGDASGKDNAGRLDLPSGRHNLAGPVYQQAKPFRLWVAPWTDANGLVHSGEYLYFTTPGRWNYGPLDMPGSAAGLLGPAMPDDLGFTPATGQQGTQRGRGNDFPGAELRPYAPGSGSTIEPAKPSDPDPNDPNSITKPAVRMTGTANDIEIRSGER